MNCFRISSGRLALLLLVFCLPRAYVIADPAPEKEQRLKDLGLCVVKVEQHRTRLKGSDAGTKTLAALDRSLAAMQAGIDRLPELAAELKKQDDRLRDLRMLELEPKQREVEQIRQTIEARFSQLLSEKQFLETETAQHNNRPHFFYDSQLAERANYIAEATALEARWQRLREAAMLVQTEMQPRFDLASRALAKTQQDFSEAAARREKAAQLLQEQTFYYTNTRSTLAEELAKLDHAAAPIVSPK